jgi:HK97 family phage major capsid protein
MENLDIHKAELNQALDAIVAAQEKDDVPAYRDAMTQYALAVEQRVLQEARDETAVKDSGILTARGVRQLTAAEHKFYTGFIEATKSKQALSDLDVVMPLTIIDDVFSDLLENHPLLDAIDFQYGRGVTEWLMNSNPTEMATWQTLCAEIVTELTSGFRSVNIAQNKLSAFIPVCRAMLDLGPVWLDRYVRAILGEALAFGLEDGIINGRGQTASLAEPIGMKKDLDGAVVAATGYPDKAAVAVTALDPVTYGALLADLAVTENGHQRAVSSVVLIVNPRDYLTKIMPATTVRAADGRYVSNVLPFPTEIIQSTRMETGKAVVGLADRYLMVSGGGKSGVIEYSDQYHFLEDERVYLTKFYGHGQPKDNSSFKLLDISGLEPAVLDVRVVNAADFPEA